MYDKLCATPSDINEHLPIIKFFASECEHITEMGVRYCVSTWAFIEAKPKKLVSIDIVHPYSYVNQGGIESFDKVVETCKEKGIDFTFIEKSTLDIEIEPTDLLFIDTLHTYDQLKQELKLHGNKARKYIVMHDTESCPELNKAIDEFLAENDKWHTKYVATNNNGLTILTCL